MKARRATTTKKPEAPPGKARKKKVSSHGGARPGAGRKGNNREPITLHLHRAILDFLREWAAPGARVEQILIGDLTQKLGVAMAYAGKEGLDAYDKRIAKCLRQIDAAHIEKAERIADAYRQPWPPAPKLPP